MQFKNTYVIFGAMVAIIFGLSNASQHPISGSSGYTGAPPDSTCGQCHTGNNSNLDGSVTIDGLPSTIITGETYTLTVTITNPNGNAVRGGFQMVALNGSNGQAGSYGATPPFTSLRSAGGKTYFGHVNAQNFPGSNELSYSIDWTAPATTGTNPVIKFYAASVIANGADGNQNDRVVLTNLQIPIQSGAQPLEATIENVMDISCFGFQDGTATVSATGGTSPYTYQWSNGVTSITNTTLPAGPFTVTVTDNVGTTSTAT
ncbi:MAG TPA: SprB repeat-containing protein, partial [Saprospiraceae bacterium]|nr:SprB repeat-containing protein [Saprospiraceae bacterium]